MSQYLETTIDKFTFRVATDRLYTGEGVWVLWVLPESNRHVRVGLSDYLQQHNGDVAFVSMKPAGVVLAAGDELAEVETIKANLSLPSPVAGKVVEVNPALTPNPELVNQDPYERGWLAVIEVADWARERAKLLDAPAYLALMTQQAEQELKQP